MDFKNEIKKLLNSGFKSNHIPQSHDNSYLKEINESIVKLDKKQREIAINIEDIQGQLQEEQTDETKVIDVLISIIDYFDDFYNFASNDISSPLFQQAKMMQNGILKKLSVIGLVRICDQNTTFDSSINSIEFTEENPSFPNGYIIKTLKSGYIYNGDIVRKSKVIVIKN